MEYFYSDNTYSVSKTNFWRYDQALFGVNLPPNVGLKGKGLSGVMDLDGDHFIAEGIPITEFSDSAPAVRQPYQLATVVVKDSTTGQVLTSTQVVTPTSSEMRCDNCHGDTGMASPSNPTGKVETNILQLHDEGSGTTLMANRPVLCASCHASNALGTPGSQGSKTSQSRCMNTMRESSPALWMAVTTVTRGHKPAACRDVMAVEKGMTCVSCHGGMTTVSNNPNPWLNEPRCDACHNSGNYNQDHLLYRFSKSHGGIYCEACHDSTHAIAPSREANDAIKFNQLQGKNGPIEECSVCHTVTPAGSGVHSLITPIISGNVGTASVTLRYTDGTAKTVTSLADGSYSFAVSYNWSGTVTPSKTGTIFTPTRRNYANVTTNKTAQNYRLTPTTVTPLKSGGAQDGWVLESGESSNQGGASMQRLPHLLLGDNAAKRQYRSLLHFNTASLPDNAVIARVVLKIKRQSVAGTNPFTTHGKIAVDIRKGAFSNNAALQITDFQATAGKPGVGLVCEQSDACRLVLHETDGGCPSLHQPERGDPVPPALPDGRRQRCGRGLHPLLQRECSVAADRPVLVIEYYVP